MDDLFILLLRVHLVETSLSLRRLEVILQPELLIARLLLRQHSNLVLLARVRFNVACKLALEQLLLLLGH